jgi:hypothetical protein
MIMQYVLSAFMKLIYSPATNYMKGGTHATMSRGRSYCVNFKWAQKENGPKSLAPITSNKNG